MPDPKDDPNSSEWRPYIFRATANIRRPCSDSSVTASQMDGVFGSDTGAAVLVRPDGYAGLTSPISSAVGHLALPHEPAGEPEERCLRARDRKSTRLNSSHVKISYAVFCLKKKKKTKKKTKYKKKKKQRLKT